MTVAGWVFMTISLAFVVGLFAWCMRKVLGRKG
jgi:hypothetical protein